VLFRDYFELQLGIAGCCALAIVARLQDAEEERRPGGGLMLAGYAALVAVLGVSIMSRGENLVGAARGAGVLRVERGSDASGQETIELKRGSVSLGLQLKGVAGAAPAGAYARASGISLVMKELDRAGGRHVGAVGLGSGALAALGRRGDRMRFYEVDPDVIALAERHFRYLKESQAKTEVVTGDARVVLEAEPPQRFDVLVLDAFTSEFFPAHLLTREAMDVYLGHLKSDGVLAINVRHPHLKLAPLVRGLAAERGFATLSVVAAGDERRGESASHWVLASREREFLARPALAAAGTGEQELAAEGQIWTDDRSDLRAAFRARP
jgi:hypothetical protein